MSVPKPESHQKSIECEICSSTFTSRNRLFRHLREAHQFQDTSSFSGEDRTAAAISARERLFNPNHDAYYKAQSQGGDIFPSNDPAAAWETTQSHFRKPLPVAFRKKTNTFSTSIHRNARSDILDLLWNEVPSSAIAPSPTLGTDLSFLCRTPPRQFSKRAQKLLSDAQDAGVLQRQELCSMIPPLLLDVSSSGPSQSILDMCCAPGSKSLQLLDQLNDIDSGSHRETGRSLVSEPPSGMLVCNDSNRARLLTLQRRSRQQPRICLVLNSSDGRHFPTLRKWGGYKVKFSRVLCDVPCSGDGTLRKLTSTEWNQWNVKTHLQLHKLQLKLLMRALELVEKGGKVVYSTCSLDPIENEAVVASAICRLGGTDVYKILPPPEKLHPSSTQRLEYSRGAIKWVVPHPKFSASNPSVYSNIGEVPAQLLKKDIASSMFPPSVRTKSSWLEQNPKLDGEDEEAYATRTGNALRFADFLNDSDIASLEEMLPNCCRILPQHLDSGGFFCAVIERVESRYYAVCCPGHQRLMTNNSNSKEDDESAIRDEVHGRIYHPVSSSAQIRELLKGLSGGVHFEGVATLEVAQAWLRQHNSYIDGISDGAVPLPSPENKERPAAQEQDKAAPASTGKKRKDRSWEGKVAAYTPMFRPPNKVLVEEFCDFYGLCSDPQHAAAARVERFPVENLVAVGGSDEKYELTNCQDPDNAHRLLSSDSGSGDERKYLKRKFFQLTLVSEQIRNLYAGGAKFNPIEVGFALCWVPIPGDYRIPPKDQAGSQARKKPQNEEREIGDDDVVIEHDKDGDETRSSKSRAEISGRYGLMDSAAEMIGFCATKRLVALTRRECFALLQNSKIELSCSEEGIPTADGAGNDADDNDDDVWWQRWGKHRLPDTKEWSPGGVIVACPFNGVVGKPSSTVFLSCVLRKPSKDGSCGMYCLDLLTEDHLASVWKRLLSGLSGEQIQQPPLCAA